MIFAVWWLGWISSIKNTAYLLLNKIAMIILGDEHQTSWINAIKSIITNMIPIAIYEGVYYRRESPSMSPLIIGATISSILTFFICLPLKILYARMLFKILTEKEKKSGKNLI